MWPGSFSTAGSNTSRTSHIAVAVVQPSQNLAKLLERLWRHLSQRRRRQLAGLAVLMVVSTFAEVVSIGAILPFLGVLTAPTRVFEHPMAQPLIEFLGLTSPEQLLLPLTIGFALAAIISGLIRVALLWAIARLAFATGVDFGISIYRRTLYQPYAVHIARNSSEVISGIYSKTQSVIYNSILPSLVLISSSIMLVVVLVALLSIDPLTALVFFGGFSFIYGIIIWLTRHRLVGYSESIARESTRTHKVLQEGLGGIRDILIDGSQEAYCRSYCSAEIPLRRAQASNVFIGTSPRYIMEALGMILIAGLAYTLYQLPDGAAKALPVLGALALGAQRLLPVLQQAYVAWASIKGGQASLQDTLELLDQSLPDHASQPVSEAIGFRQDISLNGLSFTYNEGAPWVLHNLNLTIPKGARVGFIGSTGAGKSTLLDIIMGLLPPTSGNLAIDGVPITSENRRAWQARIAHVPQSIFLSDATIAENIAFGVPGEHIDPVRIRYAAEQAQIADIIEAWPEKYGTVVGERGVRLSGGQRQRIGIARALYKQADVIILDEATSALDNETERAVMTSIQGLSRELTILIIAHRLTTLRECTQIVELTQTGIRTCTYQDIVNQPLQVS